MEMDRHDHEEAGDQAQEKFEKALDSMPDAPEAMEAATPEQTEEMLSAAAEEQPAQASPAPAKPEPKKVNIAQAMADFNHEHFWDAFYYECNRLIAEGRAPKFFAVPWDRADKLLLSAIRKFESVDVQKTKSADELIFNYDEAVPKNAPEGFQPKRHTVRVVISRCLPSNPRMDIGLLV